MQRLTANFSIQLVRKVCCSVSLSVWERSGMSFQLILYVNTSFSVSGFSPLFFYPIHLRGRGKKGQMLGHFEECAFTKPWFFSLPGTLII